MGESLNSFRTQMRVCLAGVIAVSPVTSRSSISEFPPWHCPHRLGDPGGQVIDNRAYSCSLSSPPTAAGTKQPRTLSVSAEAETEHGVRDLSDTTYAQYACCQGPELTLLGQSAPSPGVLSTCQRSYRPHSPMCMGRVALFTVAQVWGNGPGVPSPRAPSWST